LTKEKERTLFSAMIQAHIKLELAKFPALNIMPRWHFIIHPILPAQFPDSDCFRIFFFFIVLLRSLPRMLRIFSSENVLETRK